MQWSHYSTALFDTFNNPVKDNILVQACPGSGKTTNLEHLWTLNKMPTVYLVFGKDNQLYAKEKMPEKENSAVLTLNSLGHRVLTDKYGERLKLDNRKVYTLIKEMKVFSERDAKRFEKVGQLAKAVTMAKQYFLKSDINECDFDQMCDMYDLEQYEGMYHNLVDVLHASDQWWHCVDYADQVRFPALFDFSFPAYHTVLGDEWQDASPIQLEMVRKLKAELYVFVGDKHQSIYGFRGAMNDSMQRTKDMFHCVELPLSISYRCPKNIVKEAYKIFPDIEAWDQSGDGMVRYSEAMNEQYGEDDLILCRFNAPLIELAYALLRKGIACHVKGRSIADGLIHIIDKQRAINVADLIDKLITWQDAERSKARMKNDEAKEKSVQDKFLSLMLFTEKCTLRDDVSRVEAQIDSLFAQGKGVCLSTIHKAKGLEADRALILGHRELPFVTRGQQPWQYDQERNCQYVAVTRAKQGLIYM